MYFISSKNRRDQNFKSTHYVNLSFSCQSYQYSIWISLLFEGDESVSRRWARIIKK